MGKIGIFFGSTTGNTESVANSLSEKFDGAEVVNIADATREDLEKYSSLIFGTSTWGVGDLQDDWEDGLTLIEGANLEGKKVALFGLGDQESYPDSFVDGMDDIYQKVKDKCEVVGFVEKEGYSFDESRAMVDGKLIGLAIDEDNESNLTDERIDKWAAELKGVLV